MSKARFSKSELPLHKKNLKEMFRSLKLTILLVIMLSSTVRAFTSTSRLSNSLLKKSKKFNAVHVTSRFMSTTDGETSIVDTCKAKIMKALETDDVTVTGW